MLHAKTVATLEGEAPHALLLIVARLASLLPYLVYQAPQSLLIFTKGKEVQRVGPGFVTDLVDEALCWHASGACRVSRLVASSPALSCQPGGLDWQTVEWGSGSGGLGSDPSALLLQHCLTSPAAPALAKVIIMSKCGWDRPLGVG